MGKNLKQVYRKESIFKTKEYKILAAHWYAEGLYIKEKFLGSNIRSNVLYKVKRGDFIYNRLFAWKGAFGIVTADLDECYVSGEFPCFECSNTIICQLILKLFSQPSIWDKIFELSKRTSAISRKRFREEKFLKMHINLISNHQLSVFEKINNHLNNIKILYLDALSKSCVYNYLR